MSSSTQIRSDEYALFPPQLPGPKVMGYRITKILYGYKKIIFMNNDI